MIEKPEKHKAQDPLRPDATKMGGSHPDGEEPPLGRALHRVMRSIMFEEAPLPELDSLPLAQLRLLWTVFHQTGATMKDFSERLSVSQSTVTQLAERLVRRGMVERQADPADRRIVRLQLSPLGRTILGKANDRQKRTFRQIWDRLSSQDHDMVIRGLETLGQAGEALRSEQGRPLTSWPDSHEATDSSHDENDESAPPVVDLMARRVRGRVG